MELKLFLGLIMILYEPIYRHTVYNCCLKLPSVYQNVCPCANIKCEMALQNLHAYNVKVKA